MVYNSITLYKNYKKRGGIFTVTFVTFVTFDGNIHKISKNEAKGNTKVTDTERHKYCINNVLQLIVTK
jgi:hypothetical protein